MINLSSGELKSIVDPNGFHVESVTFSDISIIKESADGEPTHGGIAPLFPYANRLRDGKYVFDEKEYSFSVGQDGNSIHGYAKDRVWEVTKQESNSVTMTLSLEDTGYPFELLAEMSVELDKDVFRQSVIFSNNGERRAPLAPGFHPYFSTGDHWELTFREAPEKVIKVDDYFPDGNFVQYRKKFWKKKNHPYDDCFRYNGPLKIRGDFLNFEMNTYNASYIMVYDGKFSQDISVAVEPMSSAINAFNSGDHLKILEPGESWRFGYDFKISMM